MEQRDYLLREIEKIGAIMSAIRQKIFGGKGNLAITLEQQVKETKGMLLNKMSFDLEKFLDLNVEETNEYIKTFKGFNVENIEILAEIISEIGFDNKCDNSQKYLEKALQLYELCGFKSKTFSIEREANINAIKNYLAT
jgi:hypothetical protein